MMPALWAVMLRCKSNVNSRAETHLYTTQQLPYSLSSPDEYLARKVLYLARLMLGLLLGLRLGWSSRRWKKEIRHSCTRLQLVPLEASGSLGLACHFRAGGMGRAAYRVKHGFGEMCLI